MTLLYSLLRGGLRLGLRAYFRGIEVHELRVDIESEGIDLDPAPVASRA